MEKSDRLKSTTRQLICYALANWVTECMTLQTSLLEILAMGLSMKCIIVSSELHLRQQDTMTAQDELSTLDLTHLHCL